MCEAGRIKHHLRHNLPREECTILITGFQAAGTLGRRLVDGAKEVRISVSRAGARRDLHIGGLSAHADQAALLHGSGISSIRRRRTSCTGSPKPRTFLRTRYASG